MVATCINSIDTRRLSCKMPHGLLKSIFGGLIVAWVSLFQYICPYLGQALFHPNWAAFAAVVLLDCFVSGNLQYDTTVSTTQRNVCFLLLWRLSQQNTHNLTICALLNNSPLPSPQNTPEQDGFPVYGQLGPDGVEMKVGTVGVRSTWEGADEGR